MGQRLAGFGYIPANDKLRYSLLVSQTIGFLSHYKINLHHECYATELFQKDGA